jgi:alpha-D-ribose 1-methylphosphonate 5-triphosphate synthase subunit PhnI
MGYVAAKGGTEAILNSERLVEWFRLRGGSPPIAVRQIQDQLRHAVDRAMSEGALYAPELAALAVKQSEGDTLEASFLLRAYRSTLPRLATSLPADGRAIRCLRRISASFKDIPGGQMLGPSRDYQLRLLDTLLTHESADSVRQTLVELEEMIAAHAATHDEGEAIGLFPKVAERMRQDGILATAPGEEQAEDEPYDLTRKAISFPAPRSARLQMLARGDVGSLLTYAYSSVRGYGDAHPTLGELRVGYLPVEVPHPLTGEPVGIGDVFVTECEMVSKIHTDRDAAGAQDEKPKFGLGYGFTFGHNEVKAISMSILDRVLSAAKEHALGGEEGPATDEEFVLQHVDGIEASGFTAHYKLPHYVSFEADIKVLERAQAFDAERAEAVASRRKDVAARLAANGRSSADQGKNGRARKSGKVAPSVGPRDEQAERG